MNVPWVCIIRSRPHRAGGLYISGVDFGCFSTKYRDCEALVEREEQTDFTLLLYICARTILRLYNKIMKHKIFTFLLAVMASVGTLSAQSGTCGTNLTWNLSNKVLTISGTGAMKNYESNGAPWNSYRSSINTIVIKEGVTSIGNSAFEECYNLTSVELPGTMTSIGDAAFYYCNSLPSIEFPNSVTSIGYDAFWYCLSFTSIEIPNSITNIEDGVFAYCPKLSTINVASDNPRYCAVDGVLFNKDTTLLVQYPAGRKGSYLIPDNVTTIGEASFGSSSLTSIEIPSSVDSIGEYAFLGCSNLRNIINNAGTPQTINAYVFEEVNKTACTLYVPEESISAYKSATGWKEFANIQAIEEDTPEPCRIASGTCGAGVENLTWILTCDSVLTISGTGLMTDYASYTATPWYSDRESIKSIVIEDGVVSIGKYAFSECNSLTAITIPNSVIFIGSSAFSGCSSLTAVSIPNSVVLIEGAAFYGCSSLNAVNIYDLAAWCNISFSAASSNPLNNAKNLYLNGTLVEELVIPDGITKINDYAFYNCSSLTSVTIPNSVTCIGKSAFSGSKSLTSVNIPNSVTTIESSAFGGCSSLNAVNISDLAAWCNISFSAASSNPLNNAKNLYLNGTLVKDLVIPNGVTKINDYIFYNCGSLTSVTIPNSVTSIGTYSFYGCSVLASITIPNGVTSIGEYAFNGCKGLTSVNIPNSVTTIESSAFSGCSNLTAVYISDLTAWCNISFSAASSNPLNYAKNLYLNGILVEKLVIPDGITKINDYAFYGCSSITSVFIPNGVTSIGKYAFNGCKGLTSVNIPNSVTTIERSAFSTCSGLTAVYISDLTAWCNISFGSTASNNPLFYAKNLYLNGALVEDLVIPNGITKINDYAFYNCSSLTSVTIPNSVTSIGTYSFYGCSGLTSITIPNGVTSIGSSAFYNCTGLTSITNLATTPQAVTSYVFGNPASNTAVDYSSCTLYVPAESVEAYKAADVWKEFTNILPIGESSDSCVIASGTCGAEGDNLTWTLSCDSVLTISGTGAMTYPSTQLPWHSKKEYIKSVVIENGVTSIAFCAFYADYSALTSVTIPNSVTNIGALAFAACTSLNSIEIPNSVTDIGQLAFYDCSSLKSVIIPNSVTNIGYGPFVGCTGLTSLTVETDNTNYCSLDGVMFSKDKTVLIQCPGGKQGAYMIPNGVANIALAAFEKCSSLTSIEIPNTVTNIGNEAFASCTSLTSVVIPNSVVSIGEDVFKYCSYLTSIDVASDNPNYSSIDGVLFNKEKTTLLRCPNGNTRTEYTIPDGVTTIGQRSFESCWQLNSIIIPDGVTTIEANAFEGCVNLTSVSIANSVSTIENEAFLGCQKLTSVTNYAANPQTIAATAFSFANQSSCTLYVPAESVEAYKAADVWKEFTNILPIGESVETDTITIAQALEIGAGLEVGASTDKQYTIRGYVSSISSSFSEQYGNQSFYIADDSLSTANSNATGGFYVYRGKPTTGTAIREGALVELTTAIKNYNGENIENAEQNVLVTVLKEGPECRILSGTCGENLTWKFNNCDSVLTISGTGAMTDFASGNTTPWYSKRNSINTIVFDGGITSIGYAAFSNCTRLNAVTIPNSVTSIGDVAFRYCISLSSITIPNSVTSIGERTFADCSSLTSVTIPTSVTSIGYGAFRYCTGLSSVTIPKGVTNIGSAAFSQCTALTSVTNYAETPQPINANVFSNVDLSACTLYVPAESLEAYKTANGWKEFTNILPIGGTTPPQESDREGQSTEGKDFWVTFMQADQDPYNDLVLSLSISSRENCQVQISNPYTGYMETINVTANQMQLVELYSGNVLLANARTTMANSGKVCYAGYSEQVDTCALRVTATSDISLFATNYKRATFDATNVLPTALLGDEYFIQTYSPSDHGGVSRSQGSHFAIVATEDNTIVDYCPTVMTERLNDVFTKANSGYYLTPEDSALLYYKAGDILSSPVLMAGQVFYVWTGKKDGDAGDLSGTHVKARDGKRIAVFQGNPHTNVPYMIKQRDQLYSQAMPVRYWGNTFALTASATRPSDIIRVMAVHDGTEVYINGEPVHTFDFTVDTKHFWEFEIGPSGTYAQEGSCMLATSHPVGVHLFLTSQQYKGDKNSNGDPAMMWVSPIEHQMEQVNIATYSGINAATTSYVNVVTDKPEVMTLDGASITSNFSPVSGSNTYYYAQITLGTTAASHTLKSNGGKFNAHVYGFSSNESYAYSAGSFIEDHTISVIINGNEFTSEGGMMEWCVRDTFLLDIITTNCQVSRVDYGDGTVENFHFTDGVSVDSLYTKHAYSKPGLYQATVSVTYTLNTTDTFLTVYPLRIYAGPIDLEYEPLGDIYVGDSIFYIYYHTPLQDMKIDEDFVMNRFFNSAALEDGFGKMSTRLNKSFFGIRIPETARAGVEYAFGVNVETPCETFTVEIPFVLKNRRTGTCGDNNALTWTYDPETKTLTISGNGTLNSNYTFGPEAPTEMEQLIIAEGVTSIGANAFSNMSTLQTMQLPASLKTIGAKAFENCINLTSIYNYRERPCLVDATAFDGVNKFDCTLYVLEGSVEMYKSAASDWKDFYFILPISTTTVTEPVSDVTVEPHDNSATVTWPAQDNAVTYTIEISKDGVVFCRLTFNAYGQLTGIAFAPGRGGAHNAPAAVMTANGLQFTVTGLNSNTQYGYNITTRDSNDAAIATYSGKFTTTGGGGVTTGVDNVQGNDVQCTKVIRNGQIYILRGEKVYTVTGEEVR